jgi:GAF domain-containing protein
MELAAENARLAQELTEARQQQTATSEILRVISSSPTDLQPIFDAIVRSTVSLCGGMFSTAFRFDGELVHLVAQHNFAAEALNIFNRVYPTPAGYATQAAQAILEGKVVHTVDAQKDTGCPAARREFAKQVGFRSALSVPMLLEGRSIGAISVSRREPLPFSESQIALLQTFASQAVIAIENVRLFEAERQRTCELTESLQQQTASADVLKVISSSPGELKPVFDAMLENATRICEASFGNLLLMEGDNKFRTVALHNPPPAFTDAIQRSPVRHPGPGNTLTRMAETRQEVHIADIAADPSLTGGLIGKFAGARTLLSVPLLKENKLIGALSIYRQEVHPFTEKQIELLKSFAAQAVIAIENARLLNELRQRTDDLSESLEQQTATADVLKVISSSPGELTPVFDAMLQNAVRICEAKFGLLFRFDNGTLRPAAMLGVSPEFAEFLRRWRGDGDWR